MITNVQVRLGCRAFAPGELTSRVTGLALLVLYSRFDPDEQRITAAYTVQARDPADVAPALEALTDTFGASATVPTDDDTTVVVELDETTMQDARAPERFAIEAFPRGTTLGPGRIQSGHLRLRALVPGEMDVAELRRARDAGEGRASWPSFQLLSAEPFELAHAVNGALADALTAKQAAALRTAHAMGYYRSPRGATLDDLAGIFGISKAAVHTRLQAAERKIVASYLE